MTARDDLAEQDAVVGLAALGTDDGDVVLAGEVAGEEVLDEPRPDHAVADDDESHAGTSVSLRCRGGSWVGWGSARHTLTAQTLNSGIPETGSVASLVTRLTLASPAQWNGMKTVSGRTRSVTRAGAVTVPLALVSVTSSPEVMS